MVLMMPEGDSKVAVVDAPTYIVTPQSTGKSSSKGIQKKHVLIGVGLVVLAGLIIAGILIGMHIFAEEQKEIIKLSLDFKSNSDGQNVKQDITADPNDNSVMFHITKDGKDIYVVNDFNRDMQVVKIQLGYTTNCYVSALNRSAAMDPDQISAIDNNLQSDGDRKTSSTLFVVSESPVTDRSFLPKKAQDMCKDISLYWAYRSCNGQNGPAPNNNTNVSDRQKRTIYNAGYYGSWPCLNGCCYTVCSCSVAIYEQYYNGWYYCTYYAASCGYVKYPQATPGQVC